MNTIRKKTTTKIMALLLTLALALSLGAPLSAFAAGSPITGNEQSPAQASLTKVLKLPEGTTTPATTFEFTFTPVSVDGDTTIAGTAPAISSDNKIAIGYNSADTAAASNGIISIPKETSIFSGVTFPHAGVYTYKVVENPNTYAIADASKEQMTYSQAEYEITAYVKEKSTDSSQLYIAAIATTITKNEDGTTGSGDKVDPTPGGGTGGSYSALAFTNNYTKTGGGGGTDPTDPTNPLNSTLSISKAVRGEYASKTFYFPFSISLSAPSTLTTIPAFYRAYVVEDNDTIVTSSSNADPSLLAVDAGGPYIKVSTSAPTAVNLKHDQKLVFLDTPVGTCYTATEPGTAGYTPKVDIVTNEGNPVEKSATTGQSLATGAQLVGEKTNSADFLNTRADVSPTGIFIENLPYIVLIALALALLAGFVAIRVRRSRSNN
ncbi:MAG: hypothetical protein LBC35_01535 [Coriobacteriales bacterium]|jgi:hypothetical protein|nr:hypothetical protein [Coriobacteriales bacterium]